MTAIKGTGINVLFDGPPSHESGRFIEVENDEGRSIPVGDWVELAGPGGNWSLRIDPLDVMKTVQSKIYDTAYSHGWYSEERSFGDRMALIHSEVSEALEAFRRGDDMTRIKYSHTTGCPLFGHYSYLDDNPKRSPTSNGHCDCTPKPDGIAVELADVIIRIFDMAEAESIPVLDAIRVKMVFNDSRPYRHGGKAL